MLAKLLTYSLYGIDARPVEVEVDISPSAMPKTILVGLAEAAVKESTHRIERALVTVSVAQSPACLRMATARTSSALIVSPSAACITTSAL